MGDRQNMLADIAAAADELCDPRQNTEPIKQERRTRKGKKTAPRLAWVTTQPGLLKQLAELVYPSSASAGDGPSGSPKSKPPVFLEALSALWQIRIAAAKWCWDLRIELRDTTEGDIRSLVGAAARLPSDEQARLLKDMRRWRAWAAVLTGWESPLFKPHVPCLACGTVGTLRVNLTRKAAFCTHPPCGATWDEGTVGLLGDFIRAEMAMRARRKLDRSVALAKAINELLAPPALTLANPEVRKLLVDEGVKLIAACPDLATRRTAGRDFADAVGVNRETVRKAIAAIVDTQPKQKETPDGVHAVPAGC